MQFTCVPGNDGGIKQSFFVEVINFDALKLLLPVTNMRTVLLQVFDGKEKVFNVSYGQPTFLLHKLPSDTKLVVRVRDPY